MVATTPPIAQRNPSSQHETQFPSGTAADPGRRFDDLFNFVHDPATEFEAGPFPIGGSMG
ncbi:hypothetical protein GCM10010191_59220 [Actinomadura vinacea]|uniref:Uncharacterized protein n=1 Tax=Actinomadura vinacea TaxID=115336 RepID=A0ABN3JTB6_9ACTN